MTGADIVTAVLSEGGFDVARATALEWVNTQYQAAVAGALWRRGEVSLGVTVAGQSTYAIPATVVDLRRVKVGDLPLTRIGIEDLWEVRAGLRYAVGPTGFFAPSFDAAGAESIDLYPTPDTPGDEIVGLAALAADPLLDDPGSSPVIPDDLVQSVCVDGAISLGLRRDDERPDLAAVYDQRYQAAVGQLARRRNSRVGSGPVQIQAKGRHW